MPGQHLYAGKVADKMDIQDGALVKHNRGMTPPQYGPGKQPDAVGKVLCLTLTLTTS